MPCPTERRSIVLARKISRPRCAKIGPTDKGEQIVCDVNFYRMDEPMTESVGTSQKNVLIPLAAAAAARWLAYRHDLQVDVGRCFRFNHTESVGREREISNRQLSILLSFSLDG